MWLLLLKHWKVALCLALLVAAMGWGGYLAYRWTEAAVLKAEQAQKDAEAARDSALEANRQAEASAEAAKAARSRNDEVLPKVRRESAERVDRAATADPVQRLLDVKAATDAYLAAAHRLRAKGASGAVGADPVP